MGNINNILFAAVIFLLGSACVNQNKKPGNRKVVVDETFNRCFKRKGEGFTGGDGTYSVLLPDGRTVWIFGDTFIGGVNEDNTRTKTDPIYIRNSFIVQDGECFHTLFNDTGDINRSQMIPPQVVDSDFDISEYDQWYWPGDGFVENDMLKVFVSEFHQVDTGMWDFKWEHTALVSFSLPDLEQTNVELFDYGVEKDVHYGHAVLEDGDYTYIYGLSEGKPHVARAQAGNVSGAWEFFNGTKWTRNPGESQPMADIHGAEQFSVLKHEGKYYYITQMGGFSSQIGVLSSDKPYTGWKKKRVLYNTPSDSLNSNIFTYNAVAHPQFINEQGMLISYNTNSFVLSDHYKDADIYRPRFIRVPLDLIFQ